MQLSRWMKQGKLIDLRRGAYTVASPYRRALRLVPAALANQLRRPSYLSALWALGHYDLIPERVAWLTSVTTRAPQRFENPLGIFEYRNIKQDCFFGYRTDPHGGAGFPVAKPEKALLDHWHLTAGEWTEERLEEMRYQHFDRVAGEKLRLYAQKLHSPRLNCAVQGWICLATAIEEGTETP